MSKNLTRKGLALGAVVALSTTLIAGTPAFAAGEVTLAPSAGTLLSTIEGEGFKLATGLAASVPAGNISQLKYLVQNSSATTNTVAVTNGVVDAGTAVGTSTTDKVYAFTTVPAQGVASSITITPAAFTADSVSVTVTAFLDSDNQGDLDAGEYQSSAVTLTWVEKSKVTTTVSYDPIVVGATSLTAKIVFDGINGSQIDPTHVGAAFTDSGVALTTGYGTATGAAGVQSDLTTAAAQYSSTTNAFTVASGTFNATYKATGLVAGDIVKVWPLHNPAGAPTAALASTSPESFTYAIGSAKASAAAVRTISEIKSTVVEAAGVKNISATANGASAIDVAKSGTYTVRAVVKDVTTPTAVVAANVPVSVTYSTTATLGSLSTDPSVTIAGTKYVSTSAVAAITAATFTSNASGQIDVPVTIANFANANTLVVTITAQNYTSTVTLSANTSTAATLVDVADLTGAANTVNVIRAVKGSTVTRQFSAINYFGDAVADNAFRVLVIDTTPATDVVKASPAVVGGKATVSFTAASTETTSTYTADLEEINTATGAYTSRDDDDFNVLTVANAAAVNPASSIALVASKGAGQTGNATATSLADLFVAEEDFKAIDTRIQDGAAPTLSKGYTTSAATTRGTAGTSWAKLNVIAKDAAGLALDSVPVTVSAKGYMFVVNGVYALDTITFEADEAGVDVSFYSHVAGTSTITISSGSATKAQKATFKTVLGEAAAISFAKGATVISASGRAVDVSPKVADKWGNGVSGATVTLVQTGDAGYLSAGSGTSDSNGVVTSRLISGVADKGLSTVKASFTNADDDVVSASIDVVFGVTAKITKASTSSVVVKNAAGTTIKLVRGSKSKSVVATSASQKVTVKGGTGTVKVYVNGVLVASKK